MNVLEKEIEDMIWQGLKENRPLLREKGLWVWETATYHRQVDLGAYGICDILGICIQPKEQGRRFVNAHIVEIKKDEINSATFYQAIRYAKGVSRYIEEKLTGTICNIGITLIGKTVDQKGEFVYLADIFSNVGLYTYKLDFKRGILFNREYGYYAKNESFNIPKDIKDALVNKVSEEIKGPKVEDLPF